MNIKCPKCKTLFEIESQDLINSVKKFKCSVCGNLWLIEKKPIEKKEKSSFSIKKLLLLNVLIILIVLVCVFFFREELKLTDSYWQNLFNFIDTLIPIE
tara:strand:- start:17 stop:313 length:297 start_codon:yes stop_codon:yes gene_type:complete